MAAACANEVRDAMLRWDDHIRTLVEGTERKILGFVPATAS